MEAHFPLESQVWMNNAFCVMSDTAKLSFDDKLTQMLYILVSACLKRYILCKSMGATSKLHSVNTLA